MQQLLTNTTHPSEGSESLSSQGRLMEELEVDNALGVLPIVLCSGEDTLLGEDEL